MITSEITERLRVLGAHLDDERYARALRHINPTLETTDPPALGVDLHPGRSSISAHVLATMAVVVALIGVGWAVTAKPNDRSVVAASGAPKPGSLAAYVDEPPAWFGEPVAGKRDEQSRTGRWVSAAVGIRFGDTVLSPVLVSVTDGTTTMLDNAETIDINGQRLRSVRVGRWQTLSTTDSPYVVVSGTVGQAMLADLLSLVKVSRDPSGFSLEIGDLPDQYSLIRPPHVLTDVPFQKDTFSNSFADISINEVSEWGDAELAAAAVGVTYRQISLGRLTAWAGQSDLNSFGPLSFLTWSPQPGVVLEVTTSNPNRTIDDLAELAAKTRAVPIEDWTQLMEGR